MHDVQEALNRILHIVAETHRSVQAVEQRLTNMERGQVQIMSEQDDLKAGMDAIASAVQNATKEISALVTQITQANGAGDVVAMEDAATRLKGIADSLNTAVTSAQQAVATPGPSSTPNVPPSNSSTSTAQATPAPAPSPAPAPEPTPAPAPAPAPSPAPAPAAEPAPAPSTTAPAASTTTTSGS